MGAQPGDDLLTVLQRLDGGGGPAAGTAGTAAAGSAAVGAPLQVGGVDDGGTQRRLRQANIGGLYPLSVSPWSGNEVQTDGRSNNPAVMSTENGNAAYMGYGYLFNGATWDRARTPAKWIKVTLAAGTAETPVWTPAAGTRFRVMGGVLLASAQTLLTFRDGTGGGVCLYLPLAANVPLVLAGLGNGIGSALANNPLTVSRSASATVDGMIWGTEE